MIQKTARISGVEMCAVFGFIQIFPQNNPTKPHFSRLLTVFIYSIGYKLAAPLSQSLCNIYTFLKHHIVKKQRNVKNIGFFIKTLIFVMKINQSILKIMLQKSILFLFFCFIATTLLL